MDNERLLLECVYRLRVIRRDANAPTGAELTSIIAAIEATLTEPALRQCAESYDYNDKETNS